MKRRMLTVEQTQSGSTPGLQMKTAASALLIFSLAALGKTHACELQKGNGWQGCLDTPERAPVHFDRWAAIATDESNGAFGSAEWFSEKKRAEKKAIKQCQKNGGVNCAIKFTYLNQCASVVSGDRLNFFQTGSSREDAIARGLSRCKAEDAGCEVFYVGCSPAHQL